MHAWVGNVALGWCVLEERMFPLLAAISCFHGMVGSLWHPVERKNILNPIIKD